MQLLPFVEAFTRLLCKSSADVYFAEADRGARSYMKAIASSRQAVTAALQLILKITFNLHIQ